jgi:hypothetical protein
MLFNWLLLSLSSFDLHSPNTGDAASSTPESRQTQFRLLAFLWYPGTLQLGVRKCYFDLAAPLVS